MAATLAGVGVGAGLAVAHLHRLAPAPTVPSVTEHTLLTADTASGWLTHGRDETGELLWRHELDKGPIGPPITFMDHGQQGIAVTSTAGVTVFGLDGK